MNDLLSHFGTRLAYAASIFAFHELPPEIRRIVVKECARVLKPGGRLILLDSLQRRAGL